ncbi:MAG: hypothetical protein JNL82_30135 [Myxococcales bacterium]|nr:hypothetical protein [Myxococcales bacterium]
MTRRCSVVWKLGAFALLVTACKGGEQAEGSTGAEPATTSTSEVSPTEDVPTSETGDDPSTGGTTGGGLEALCRESFNNGQQLVEAQCTCLVEQGNFPDVGACLEQFDDGPATDECTCEAYAKYPEIAAGLACATPVQAMALACLAGVSCAMGDAAFAACMNPYFEAIGACVGPPKAAIGEVELVCEMKPPFACGSGETIPEEWTCDFNVDCADESDESSCPDSFTCADGNGYIPGTSQCDGSPDCPDGSDEIDCATFMCMNGSMILEGQKCNGAKDCPDGSDEGSAAGCAVFLCTNGLEIPESYRCDGFYQCCEFDPDPDCMDQSDEADCPSFMCSNGMTIPESWQCDGVADCVDGSDEADCRN